MGNITPDGNRLLIGGGIMMRNHGQPYSDGQDMRCSSCNGKFEDGACRVCGATPQRFKHATRPEETRELARAAVEDWRRRQRAS